MDVPAGIRNLDAAVAEGLPGPLTCIAVTMDPVHAVKLENLRELGNHVLR